MLYYNPKNKPYSKNLRKNSTDAERLLWSRLRRKQINNVQFYRQKPLLNYIVDFYAPTARLVVELDGGQHYDTPVIEQDIQRDAELAKLNLKVLRFSNIEVMRSLDSVLEMIFQEICFQTNPP